MRKAKGTSQTHCEEMGTARCSPREPRTRNDRPRKTDEDFIRAGNAAMRARYEEIGLKLPPA